MVVPSANVLLDAGKQVTATDPSTRSLADAVNVTAAPLGPVASAVMLAGITSTGAVVSWIITAKFDEPVFPCASVAEHVTGVSPSGNVAPEAGVQATATVPSTMSLAVGVE